MIHLCPTRRPTRPARRRLPRRRGGRGLVLGAADRVRGGTGAGHRLLAQRALGGGARPVSLIRRRAEFAATVPPRLTPVLRAGRGGARRALRVLGAQRQADHRRGVDRTGRHPAGLAGADRGRPTPPAAVVTWVGIGIAVLGAALATGADFGQSGSAVLGDVLALSAACWRPSTRRSGSGAGRRISTTTYTTICYGVCAVLLLACAWSAACGWAATGDHVAGDSRPGGRRAAARALDVQLRAAPGLGDDGQRADPAGGARGRRTRLGMARPRPPLAAAA